jgi:hypothetical protein
VTLECKDIPMTTTRPTDLIKSSRAAELPVRVGVLLYDASIDVDAIIASAVTLMRSRGIAVAGLLQHFGEPLPNGKRSMWLEDIMTGTTLRLDRPRGPGATACILDPDALAHGACLLQQAISSGADLLVVNRFGNAEADGSGMRAELAEAVCCDAAVLVAVRYSLLNDFEGFLGGPAHLLLPAPSAVADWAEGAVTRHTSSSRRN